MAVTPKWSWPWVRTLLHSVYDEPDAQSVVAQYDRIIDALSDELPKVADQLEDARADLLASTALPEQAWRQIEDSWSCGWRSGICASGYASNGSHRES
jgi:putative transposase